MKFANAWGCEVTAFTTSESKIDEAKRFGAHNVITSYDTETILKAANSFDLLLVTVNVPLDWETLLKTLKPNGRLHVVGAVLEPMPIPAMALKKCIRFTTPAAMATMLEFAARHNIAPQVEHFPMSKVNDALAHLISGIARYRIVLDVDF